MADREKVIDALNRCTLQGRHSEKMHQEACAACLYRLDRKCNFTALMKDALELLEEQEPVAPTHSYSTYRCGKCECIVGIDDLEGVPGCKSRYCADCGRKVKWD